MIFINRRLYTLLIIFFLVCLCVKITQGESPEYGSFHSRPTENRMLFYKEAYMLLGVPKIV